MIRRFVAWLFGRIPDPGPLFPMESDMPEPAAEHASRQDHEEQMLRDIDAKLNAARAHLVLRERREHPR